MGKENKKRSNSVPLKDPYLLKMKILELVLLHKGKGKSTGKLIQWSYYFCVGYMLFVYHHKFMPW